MGIGLVIAGAALLLLSFTTLDWYSGAGGPDSAGASGFSDLHHNAAELGANGVTIAYFSWTSWTLLILLILIGTFGATARRQSEGLRIAGLMLGLVGAALTYYALHDISITGKVFDHAAAGLWLALLGFVLAGAGSAIGSWPWVLTPTPAPAAELDEPPAPPPARPRPRPRPRPGPHPPATTPTDPTTKPTDHP